ncbi:hypothetical protein F966_03634 [Acinetobacter higginsii]|uniref:Uncharacterized protein n=1 Tax=Acinetobacter higginsii TaxID=70347 RepID=N8W6V9_9GAMM|nr:hypothetical protein [Acinetobacter higginsii]ENV07777.1 hypothetical protein F966_03634 [Acinetobacter higginsii]
MNNYKIINTHTNEIIKALNELGYVWTPKMFDEQDCLLKAHWILAEQSGSITYSSGTMIDSPLDFQELTLPQLRVLVAKSKAKVREYLDPNDNYKLCLINPSDAAHWMIEVPEGATLLTKDVGGYLTFWNGDLSMNMGECGWSSPEEDNGVLSFDEYKDYGYATLWSREPIQEQGLISGADVPRLIKDGHQVQYRNLPLTSIEAHVWWDFSLEKHEEEFTLGDFINTRFEWRIKPHTIKLEVEIPAPFEPKVGEVFFVLYPTAVGGYSKMHITDQKRMDDYAKLGAWRTEEEIKQVVAALRGING